MNVLAHFHLAGADPDLQSGALLGDHVKGPLKGELPAGWETGIRLHRRIDALTDASPQVQTLLKQSDAEFRRYLGITLDVVFDHCLCAHWPLFSDSDLQSYSDQLFAQMLPHSEAWPEGAQRQLQRLHQHNVLVGLNDWQTVDAMIRGISRRLSKPAPLLASIGWARQHLPAIDQAFLELYPRLQSALAAEFDQLNTPQIAKDSAG